MTYSQSRPISLRMAAALATAQRHITDLRGAYADIPAATRRRITAFAVFVIGAAFAVKAAVEMFEIYRQSIGPVVWDAAHGQRDAVTTLSAGIVAITVFVLVARVVGRAVAGLRRDDEPTPPRVGDASSAATENRTPPSEQHPVSSLDPSTRPPLTSGARGHDD